MRTRSDSGQATVELVALLPVLALLAAGVWQGTVAAQGWWLSGIAARAAARAEDVGGDPGRAARAALPSGWARRTGVEASPDGRLRVHVAIPSALMGITIADASTPVSAGRSK